MKAYYNNETYHKGRFSAFVELAKQYFREEEKQNENQSSNYTNESLNNISQNELDSRLLPMEEKMPGITRRKDGRYEIRKMENGVRKSLYARTFEEARRILVAFKHNRIKISKQKKEKKVSFTFKQWVNEWLQNYKLKFVTKPTQKEIRNICNRLILKLGNKKLQDITPNVLQTYLNSLEHNRSKEKICVYINAILQKATDLDYIQKNPFKAVVLEKKLKLKNYCFNYNEQVKILEAIKGSDIEHEIYIYLLTGCRPNELPKKENFHFDDNYVVINGTKNENAKHREVEITDSFKEYIQDYVQGNKLKSVSYISKQFKDICESIGIEKPLLYRLRHTFATNHFTLGTRAKQVQEWMGHSSVSITMDIYTDIDKTSSKEKIQKLYKNFYYVKEK